MDKEAMVVGGVSCKKTHTSIPTECKISHLFTSTVVALPPNAWLPKLCKLLCSPTVPVMQFIAVYLFIPVIHLLTKSCCADDPLLFPAL